MKIINNLTLLLVSFLSFAMVANSQVGAIDSLKIELQNHKLKDTTRVNLLNKIAFSYRRKDLKKTFEYIQESHEILDAIQFEKGKARSFYILGVAELMQSNYDVAIAHFENAIDIYNTINYKNDIAVCYMGIGIVYYYQGHNETALTNYKKAQEIDKELGIKKSIITNTYNIGVVYVAMGKYQEGLTNYKNTLELYREDDNKKAEGNVLNSIAHVYKKLGDFPGALEYYQKSLSVCETINDSIGIARAFNGIGNIYKNQARYDDALIYHKKSLIIQENKKNKKNIATVKANIGGTYKNKGDYHTAIKFFEEALEIGREIKAQNSIASDLNRLGNTYVLTQNYRVARKNYDEAIQINRSINNQAGLFNSYIGLSKVYLLEKKYRQALAFAVKGNDIANTDKLIIHKGQAHKLLSEIYAKTGDFENAFKSYQLYKKLNDSIFNKKNIEKIAQLESEYKYQKALDSASIRELQLTKTVAATNENLVKTQRNYLWAIIGVLLISMLLGAVIFYQKLRHEKAKAQNVVIEQKLLRSQMTPHFIFNSLSVLQGMILNKEDKKSVSYLSKFSKLLRITLENSRDKTVSLEHELKAIQSYLALQNLENDAYEYNILVEETIDAPMFEIPPMLIQPFVENSVEHAFVNKTDNMKIVIRLTYKNKNLVCTITDNGIGYESQDGPKNGHKNSLSTAITSERLKMLSKDLGMEGSVMIEDRINYNEQGTLVTLVIPHKLIVAS